MDTAKTDNWPLHALIARLASAGLDRQDDETRGPLWAEYRDWAWVTGQAVTPETVDQWCAVVGPQIASSEVLQLRSYAAQAPQ